MKMIYSRKTLNFILISTTVLFLLISDFYYSSFVYVNSSKIKQNIIFFSIKIVVLILFMMCYIFYHQKINKKKLQDINNKYQILLSNILGGVKTSNINISNKEIVLTYFNDGFTALTGYSKEYFTSNFENNFTYIIHKDDISRYFNEFSEQAAQGDRYNLQYRIFDNNGNVIWIMDNGIILNRSSKSFNCQSIITDITTIKMQEVALTVNEKRFRVVLNAACGAIFEYDLLLNEFTYLENFYPIIGISQEQIKKQYFSFNSDTFDFYNQENNFYHQEDLNIVASAYKELNETNSVQFETRILGIDNNYKWYKINIINIVDSDNLPIKCVGHIVNINDIKCQAEHFKQKSEIDLLTGIYNKMSAKIKIEELLAKFPYSNHALIIFDIDNFKQINDTNGHLFGDDIIVKLCNILKQDFRSTDILGRIGGDEFIVFMPNFIDNNSIASRLDNLCQKISNQNTNVTFSIGIATSNQNASFNQLFLNADKALYSSKKRGKSCYTFFEDI